MQGRNRSGTRSAEYGGLVRRCAALALLPLLSGCVAAAAVAVPAMTAAGVLTKRGPARPEADPPAAEAAAEPVSATVIVDETPALASADPESEAVAATPSGIEVPEAGVEITELAALPPPTPADLGANPWNKFVNYAIEQGAALTDAGTNLPDSALLSSEGITSLTAQRQPCGGTEPGVIIDLDNGEETFSPENAGPPAPGLASALARLREVGVVVLWISRADANRVDDVAETLRSTGLDPEGRDPLLLVLSEEQRKQTMRDDANENVCILAIAGDQRADFDELFDYLRNSDAAVGLEALIDSGWFLTPAPLASQSTSAE